MSEQIVNLTAMVKGLTKEQAKTKSKISKTKAARTDYVHRRCKWGRALGH